jgi:flagellar M-ring protein FliF
LVRQTIASQKRRAELAARPMSEPDDEPALPAITATGEDERKSIELPTFSGDDALPAQSSGLEIKLEFLQKLAISDTDRVAEVIRQWITSNERIDNK